MNGYDIDGVLTKGIIPKEPFVIISGRTWSETDLPIPYRDKAWGIALRGRGIKGDSLDSAIFKSTMIHLWQVLHFYEDDPIQINYLQQACYNCVIMKI